MRRTGTRRGDVSHAGDVARRHGTGIGTPRDAARTRVTRKDATRGRVTRRGHGARARHSAGTRHTQEHATDTHRARRRGTRTSPDTRVSPSPSCPHIPSGVPVPTCPPASPRPLRVPVPGVEVDGGGQGVAGAAGQDSQGHPQRRSPVRPVHQPVHHLWGPGACLGVPPPSSLDTWVPQLKGPRFLGPFWGGGGGSLPHRGARPPRR